LHIMSFSSGLLINPYKIPLLNTALLLTSGAFLTASHLYLRLEIFKWAKFFIILTIIFGIYFFYFQACEYFESGFSINDGIYGSLFFVLTGFHGIHVIVGTIFLIICCLRLYYSHFTAGNHFAFEAAAWYWHFVDVVWILLFLLVYLWPSARYFGGHRVDVVLHKFGEYFQPAIFFNINIKETLHYTHYTKEQLPHYNSIFYGSSRLPVNEFISTHHWSSNSEIQTPQMGLYFTKILFKRIGEAARNTFFFEVLYTTFEKVETQLVTYFVKNYDWAHSTRSTQLGKISGGGFDLGGLTAAEFLQSYKYEIEKLKVHQSHLEFSSDFRMKFSYSSINTSGKIPFIYWTTYINKPFSFNGVRSFLNTPLGLSFNRLERFFG